MGESAAKWRGVFAWVFLRIAWEFLQLYGEARLMQNLPKRTAR